MESEQPILSRYVEKEGWSYTPDHGLEYHGSDYQFIRDQSVIKMTLDPGILYLSPPILPRIQYKIDSSLPRDYFYRVEGEIGHRRVSSLIAERKKEDRIEEDAEYTDEEIHEIYDKEVEFRMGEVYDQDYSVRVAVDEKTREATLGRVAVDFLYDHHRPPGIYGIRYTNGYKDGYYLERLGPLNGLRIDETVYKLDLESLFLN